ncbi:hypothetical protein PSECIP111854_04050 [Pseudoalteromonas sp. CIP111854]|uniref:Uncharacterized protein n=1 Tax=Pseudoalteromonas holothuriae TaxID=2963714 RepID=A0A9W4R523_9GAMM|nr:hypothetical protein [Pseudoalteromonas sp. CIP111854]CAH9067228.1 hypothetical protein PSECIP111854_04050 [Pseudoalteromonas sp. CIP111854]
MINKASVESKIESSTLNTHYGVRWNDWGWGMQSQTTAKEYDVGILVIDVIDNALQQLIDAVPKKVDYVQSKRQSKERFNQ